MNFLQNKTFLKNPSQGFSWFLTQACDLIGHLQGSGLLAGSPEKVSKGCFWNLSPPCAPSQKRVEHDLAQGFLDPVLDPFLTLLAPQPSGSEKFLSRLCQTSGQMAKMTPVDGQRYRKHRQHCREVIVDPCKCSTFARV